MNAWNFGRKAAMFLATGFVLSMSLAACSSDDPADEKECKTATECPGSQVCSHQGRCIPNGSPTFDTGLDATSDTGQPQNDIKEEDDSGQQDAIDDTTQETDAGPDATDDTTQEADADATGETDADATGETDADATGETDADATGDTGSAGEDCLIISEYVMGSSHNKAAEIYNCGDDPIDLTDYYFCTDQNKNDARTDGCSKTIDLQGQLAAREVQVLCSTRADQQILDICDYPSGNIQHNGDDRMLIFRDENANAAFDFGTDTLMDAFGEIGHEEELFKDITLDRCNFTPFSGVGTFDISTYYADHPKDTFTGLGVAPTEGCAP